MSIAQSLLPEFDQEMDNTRKMLERLPEDKLEYKPDPKSMALGRLAGHIAEMAGWGTHTMTTDSLDLTPGGKQIFEPLVAKSRKQLLGEFDKNVAEARKAIAGASDEAMLKTWSLLSHGKSMLTMPRIGVLRTMVMNHTIHHRAQLGVYFRLVGVPVPGMYGPSADEKSVPAGA
jgi:uncharacterized damage-inducible protein DinB